MGVDGEADDVAGVVDGEDAVELRGGDVEAVEDLVVAEAVEEVALGAAEGGGDEVAAGRALRRRQLGGLVVGREDRDGGARFEVAERGGRRLVDDDEPRLAAGDLEDGDDGAAVGVVMLRAPQLGYGPGEAERARRLGGPRVPDLDGAVRGAGDGRVLLAAAPEPTWGSDCRARPVRTRAKTTRTI